MFDKGKKINYTVVVLSALVVIAFGYIIIEKWADSRQQRLDALYQRGFDAGVESAAQTIMNQITADLNSYGATAVTIPTSDGGSITVPLIAQTTIIQSLNNNGFFALNTLNQNNETVQVQLIMPEMCDQFTQTG